MLFADLRQAKIDFRGSYCIIGLSFLNIIDE